MRVLVFGDSIAFGASDIEGGWVQHLRNHYREIDIANRTDVQPDVYNVSISGDRSRDVLERIENETIARDNDNIRAIIIAIGINDSQTDSGIADASIDEYVSNLNAIFDIAKKYTKKVIAIGLSPVDDLHSNPLEWDEPQYQTICYTNSIIQKYDRALEEVCVNNAVAYINIFDAFTQEMNTPERSVELLPDATHPSNQGHKFIYKNISERLTDLIDRKKES